MNTEFDAKHVVKCCAAAAGTGLLLRKVCAAYRTPPPPAPPTRSVPCPETARRPFDECEVLNEKEQNEEFLRISRVQSVTYFRQKEGAEDGLVEYLRDRVAQMIAKNPWMAGEIRLRDAKDSSSPMCLTWRHEVSAEEAAEHFHVFECDERTEATLQEVYGRNHGVVPDTPPPSFSEFSLRILEKYSPAGVPLVFYSLLRMKSGYLLVSSCSHIVADGATHYMMRAMLSNDVEVQALDNKRVPEADAMTNHWMPNGLAAENMRGFLFGIMCSKLYMACSSLPLIGRLFPPQAGLGVFIMNQTEINRRKKISADRNHEGRKDVKYVSSNDVMTTWWWNKFLRKGQQVWCVLNLRGRAEGVTSTKAGNYIGTMIIQSDDKEVTPEHLREVLIHGNNSEHREDSTLDYYTRQVAFLTNWKTFHRKLVTPTHDQVMHLPVVDLSMRWGNCLFVFGTGCGDDETGIYGDRTAFCAPPSLDNDSMVARQLMRG